MYESLSDEQLQKLLIISQMASKAEGNSSIINALNNQALSILLPETDEMDEMASLYSLTEDEGLKQDMLSKYYEGQGIDPTKKAQEQALLAQFAEQFPSESQDAGKNISYQTFNIMKEHLMISLTGAIYPQE